jgi:oligopeptide transport system permease protein
MLFPALLISLIMLSFNILGDGLRDALDPNLKN